jgi:putative ABC transport system permease protein
VVTIALTGKRYALAQIEGVGANLVYANVINSGDSGSTNLADQIAPADLEAVKEGLSQLVTEVAGTNSEQLAVSINGQERPIDLVGVTPGYETIHNLEIVRGRYFDESDLAGRSKVCLITEDLARRVFPFEDPDGKQISAGELHFTVIGVFRERLAVLGPTEITRDSAIIPFSLLRYYTGTDYFATLYAKAVRADDVQAVTQQVKEIIQSRHRPGAQYRVQNLSGILETAKTIALALTVVLVLIALIALAIGGIGIMNIMLVTVTERTREIGIRKAIGASGDAIRYQFLMEAMAISGTGALAGIFIAILIPVVLRLLLGLFPDTQEISIPISWLSVVLAFVVSCSTGLIFGYLPANRAARLQPTEALRHE